MFIDCWTESGVTSVCTSPADIVAIEPTGVEGWNGRAYGFNNGHCDWLTDVDG